MLTCDTVNPAHSTNLSAYINLPSGQKYGSTSYFDFNTTIPTVTTSLSFEDVTYPINDNIFLLPAQSTVTSKTKAITRRGAMLTSLVTANTSMTGVLFVPTTQQSSAAYAIQNVTVTMDEYGTAGNYTLFEGSTTVVQVASVVGKVFMGDYASRTVKTALFVGGVYLGDGIVEFSSLKAFVCTEGTANDNTN